jgi:hypothetical protein
MLYLTEHQQVRRAIELGIEWNETQIRNIQAFAEALGEDDSDDEPRLPPEKCQRKQGRKAAVKKQGLALCNALLQYSHSDLTVTPGVQAQIDDSSSATDEAAMFQLRIYILRLHNTTASTMACPTIHGSLAKTCQPDRLTPPKAPTLHLS